MKNLQGLYWGKKSIGSTYSDGIFIDENICIEDIENTHGFYWTASGNEDKFDLKLKVCKEDALAYYAHYLNNVRKSKQKVYQIICTSDMVKMLFYTDFNTEKSKILLEKEKPVLEEDKEYIYALEKIGDIYQNKYPDALEIKELVNWIDAYKLAVICGEEHAIPVLINQLIECLNEQVELKNETIVLLYQGYELKFSFESYVREVMNEVVENYLNVIRGIVNETSINFSCNDVVHLYMGRYSCCNKVNDYLCQIENENKIIIEHVKDQNLAVARGNAYYFYLRNIILQSEINGNVGRFSLKYLQEIYCFEERKGNVFLIIKEDLRGKLEFVLKDKKNNEERILMFELPFYRLGDVIQVEFTYMTESLQVEFYFAKLDERKQYIISYKI